MFLINTVGLDPVWYCPSNPLVFGTGCYKSLYDRDKGEGWTQGVLEFSDGSGPTDVFSSDLIGQGYIN